MSKLKGKKTLQVQGILEEFEKQRIKDKVDIVELFREFGVKLEPKGKSWVGRCPWHNDKNPSLSVDRRKGLYNCFGCGEGGDVFTLVEKMKGYSFKQALDYLKTRAGHVALKTEAPENKAQETEASKTKVPETELLKSLEEAADYYYKKLPESAQAQACLEQRGLKDKRLYVQYKLGYADGSLVKVCSKGQKKALTQVGIIRDTGQEHFTGCITVPLYNPEQRVVGMYGRSIEQNKHLYLPGPPKGLFNQKAAMVYKKIIVTESIIDSLSLIQQGIENVVACYGVNGFTQNHLKLFKDNLVREVIIGFDNDEAGNKGAENLKQKLLAQGFKVKVITPPKGKDWNDYLLRGGTKQEIKALIEQAEAEEAAEEEKAGLKAKALGPGVYEFKSQEITYRVVGVKQGFVDELKVMVKAEKGAEKFYDKVDLYLARSRNSYSSGLSSLFRVEVTRIEKDLIGIIQYLEEQRDKALEQGEQEKQEQELSPEEIKLGEEFLKSPDIYKQIVEDMEVLGYVGEETNKKIVYLVAVSRLLEQPLSVYIQAGSGSGKSYLLETLRKLLPPNSVKAVTSFSDQSLNYLKEQDFRHKVFMIGEAIHNEVVEAQVRQMQSENELARLVTIKDSKTGELVSKEIRHKVNIAFMMSSTALYLNPENASRCLVLHVDESSKQTERVLKKQRQRRTVKGYIEQTEKAPKIINKHVIAQKLLTRQAVFNPYAPCLRFPKSRPSMRRAQKQFLGLIDASCLLRQKQKQEVERIDPHTGKIVRGIECDLEDYREVRELFVKGVLRGYFTELPQGAKELYEVIRKYCRKKALSQRIKPEEVTFIQKEIRELTMLGDVSVKRYIRILVEYEYLQVVSGKRHGTRYSYRLREDKSIEEIDVSIIPTVEEIEEMLKKQKEQGEQEIF